MEYITRDGINMRTRKKLEGCVHAVVGNKKFLFQFEDGKKNEIIYYLLVFLSLKEKVEMDVPLSHSPEK